MVGIGSAATVIVVALAWGATSETVSVLPAFFAVIGTCALAGVGMFARHHILRTSEALARTEARAIITRDEAERQRLSVDALGDGLDIALFICDTRGTIQYANQMALRMFTFSDPAGRALLAVTLCYDMESLVQQAAESNEAQEKEFEISYPQERTVIAKAWSPEYLGGRLFLTVRDVTDLRRLERVRKDFVANVSHELRTPMTLIRAMAETLQDEADPDDDLSHKYLGRITSEVDRLSKIAQDLLFLSVTESTASIKQTDDIADLTQDIVSQLVVRAKEKGLDLHYCGVEALRADFNRAQMTQVIINLIENAINYTQTGSIDVYLDEEDGYAVLRVKDTGIGIASEHQKRVFERFYRADKARSRNSGGTGLGLSIVKHIVESHGGSVALDSSLNLGSTFTVRIPTNSDILGS